MSKANYIKIGAAWYTKKGNGLSVKMEDGKQFFMFENKYKTKGSNQPDYYAYDIEKVEDEAPTDDVPF